MPENCTNVSKVEGRYKVKLATVVEFDPKAFFLIATTSRYRGGRNSIPWIAPLYPWSVPYNAEHYLDIIKSKINITNS